MINREFPLDEDLCYLNHAAVSPWPRRSVEAVEAFARENLHQGSLAYPQWMKTEQQLREQLRQLIGAPSAADIALLKNTSEALSIVAHGLDWQAGDNVVSSDQEFPSNRIVWESLRDKGVELREVELDSADTPEAALMARVDANTRLIAISSVQYGSGLCMDLERLGRFCHEREILFCVDAIQSVGALQVDVQACHIDFLAADGHKWMLGPEGLAVFYCRAELRESLRLSQYGWHMVEDVGNFDKKSWQPARSARRFECGSPNMLTIHALHASLELLLETGMARVEQAVLANTESLFRRLSDIHGLEILTPRQPGRYAGIVTFRIDGVISADLYNELMYEKVFCAPRGGGIRLSPHFYTPTAVLDKTIERLQRCIGILRVT